jgi:hypothetical protein
MKIQVFLWSKSKADISHAFSHNTWISHEVGDEFSDWVVQG